MKRKFWIALLSLVCVVACAFIFAACDGSDDGPNDGNNKPVLISINEDDVELCVGESKKLTATILREDVADKKIIWHITDTDFAVIDEDGNLTALSVGYGSVSAWLEGVNNERVYCHYNVNSECVRDGILFDYNPVKGYYWVISVDKELDTPVVIPAELYGIPVSGIQSEAFKGCTLIPSVTIPSSVTEIYYNTFKDCTSLESVTILDGVTKIGTEAFSGCTSLTDITIPDSVTGIGYETFSGCTSLTSITIPNSATYIGQGAFSGCTSLTDITIPNSVTYIGRGAFSGCTSLTDITIPDSVTGIEYKAFSGCTSLTSITLPAVWEDSSQYYVDYGFGRLFGANQNNDSVPSSLKTVVINGGTTIGSGAFSGCTSLTSITIPDSVISIGNSAFHDCSALTSITVSEDNTAYASQGGILYNKDKTKILLVPEGIAGAISIANGVSKISGDGLFRNCSLITSITIPDSVIEISNIFWRCSSLESITVSENNAFYASQDGILYNKEKTELIFALQAIKGAVVLPSGVTNISGYAFSGCSLLTSITIPSSVETIGYNAFCGCDSLASITLSLTTQFIDTRGNPGAKFGCIFGGVSFGNWGENGAVPSSLKTIIISGGVNIPYRMFENCREITSVTIPNSVSYIGEKAFYGCVNLAEINGAMNVATIEADAFTDTAFWTGLLNQPDDVVYWGTKLLVAKAEITECTIEDGTTAIMSRAFKGSSLTGITIPASVVSIGISAFADSKNLRSVTFAPNSQLEDIGSYVFNGCSALEEVVLPEGVTVMYVGTFEGCTSLKTVAAPLDGINYVPSSVLKLTITNGEIIEAGALSKFYNLTELIIGAGVQELKPSALRGLGALQKLTLQDMGYTLGQLFGTEYFNGAVKVNQVVGNRSSNGQDPIISGDLYVPITLTHVTVMGELPRIGAFSYCENLTDIIVLGENAMIPYYTFYRCTSLRTIVLPSALRTVNHFAIYECGGALEKIFYAGTGSWSFPQDVNMGAKVSVLATNDDISTKVYFYSSEPMESGRYWHYDDDGKTPIAWAAQA